MKKVLPERNVGDETQPAETRREQPDVNAVQGPERVVAEDGETAQIRARRAWLNWDETEVAEELVPWPAGSLR
ncbi:MAG: hypothetical protein IPM35_01835 [Myxococcales bacterium]|nr:hypothetical protein [Myxococcales bacterium]